MMLELAGLTAGGPVPESGMVAPVAARPPVAPGFAAMLAEAGAAQEVPAPQAGKAVEGAPAALVETAHGASPQGLPPALAISPRMPAGALPIAEAGNESARDRAPGPGPDPEVGGPSGDVLDSATLAQVPVTAAAVAPAAPGRSQGRPGHPRATADAVETKMPLVPRRRGDRDVQGLGGSREPSEATGTAATPNLSPLELTPQLLAVGTVLPPIAPVASFGGTVAPPPTDPLTTMASPSMAAIAVGPIELRALQGVQLMPLALGTEAGAALAADTLARSPPVMSQIAMTTGLAEATSAGAVADALNRADARAADRGVLGGMIAGLDQGGGPGSLPDELAGTAIAAPTATATALERTQPAALGSADGAWLPGLAGEPQAAGASSPGAPALAATADARLPTPGAPPAATEVGAEPMPSSGIASERLGAVRIGLEGGIQDLRVSLAVGAGAGLVAAEAPRLVADLAALGVRVHSLDITGGGGAMGTSGGNPGGDPRPRGFPPAASLPPAGNTYGGSPGSADPLTTFADRYA